MAARSLVIGSVLASATVATAGPRIGVMTDLGVPDGATASLMVQPVGPIRLSAGAGHNGVSPGVRGELTLVPLSSWITPTLSVSYGRYFERDANPLVRRVLGDPTFSSPMLEQVGYDYADAQLGLELGGRHVRFYLHGGVTQVTSQVHNLSSATGGDAGQVSITFTQDPAVSLRTLSARVGLIFYIL
jgi:hypothetical protein